MVLITDLGMPTVNGYSVAAAIKAMSPRTPVILLWGHKLRPRNALNTSSAFSAGRRV